MNTETTTLFTQHNLYRHYEHWDIHIIGNIIMYRHFRKNDFIFVATFL